MKPALLVILSILPSLVFAQQSDMLVLKKKNNRTVETFFAGKQVKFVYADGQWMKGEIRYIARDSVFLNFFDIRPMPTGYGTYSIDTIAVLPFALHYRDMVAFPRRKDSWRFIKNGTLFKIGGAGYILLNVINGQYLDEPITDSRNLRSLGIAAGVFGAGFLMGRLHKPLLEVGKKYKLHYVSLTR